MLKRALAAAVAIVLCAPAIDAAAAAPVNVGPARQKFVRRAPPPKAIDWDRITQEATELLSKYIQIDTTDPPGNELAAAKMLKEEFLEAGIPATTWEPKPGRGIVAARLRGIGRHSKAIVLLSHLDVVPANPKEWSVPPFSGQVKNGKIWGRGAIDDKGPGVIEAMAMIAIKRAGILLDRDVLFVATGAEEAGGKEGAGWFTDHQHAIFSDAGYLLNEGGAIRARPGGRKVYLVAVTEKTPLWIKLTATGPAGHASEPPPETAVTRLVRALQKVIDFRTPVRVTGPVRDYYRALARIDGGPKQYLDLAAALKNPAYLRKFLSGPGRSAQVRDTITPTILAAGIDTNVISPSAYAELDCRLLPGDDPAAFIAKLRKAIGDNSIRLDILLSFPPAASPSRSPLMTAIETLAHRHDDAQVAPAMTIGFTDSHYFRRKKIVSYGFMPIELTAAETHGVHGIDEHIKVTELGEGIRRMVELLRIFGGRP